MTDRERQLTVIACAVLAVSGVILLTSHNRNLTMIMGGVVLLTIGYLATDLVLRAIGRRRDREHAEALRKVPWTVFSEPTSRRGERRIGVRRVTEEGVILARDEANDEIVLETDAIAKLDAQGNALSRAAEYNEGQVWM